MKSKGLIIVIAIIALLAIVCVTSYNGLATAQVEVDEQAANIDSQLQRRADLIPNLVNTVKGYAAHESEVFGAVNAAREKLVGADGMADKAEANGELTNALGRLIAISENYPDLKANTTFTSLMDELAGTENRIATSRRDYNEAVKTYNRKIKVFPGNIFAGMFGFESAEFFEAAEGAENVPQVSF